jgi:hypothetical protein
MARIGMLIALSHALAGLVLAADAPKVIAAGEWSKPVSDRQGYALRGRLIICEHARSDNFRETPVYIELQDASEARGRPMRLFCDMGKHDFRPEYKGGLKCEMRDKNDQLVPPKSYFFGGGVPVSQWTTLPLDATIRLRATPFGMRSATGMAIVSDLASKWEIDANDTKEYFLSGTFTIDPADEPDQVGPDQVGKDHVWRGTIDLPAVRIANAVK